MPPDIADKVYFKIGEVATIVGVEPHVLRFWESQFPQIKPVRSGTQQRLYRREDLDTFLII
ncbi:MAG: MerR family transcriptional regulator, partial [Deltaproteobacteria bacterium]|nr:MerR family transcriptional regulator [Deltaproteobacteria bacterium]